MSDLPRCCQQAVLDGFSPEEHFPVCDARREESGALLDLDSPKTPEGGPLL
jgi:hypothetical protein